MIRDTLSTLLQTSSNNSSLVVHLTNDEDGTDDARRKTLEDNRLIVIYWYLGTIICKGYRIRGRRWIIRLRWRRRRSINTTCRLIDINDIHDKRVYPSENVIRSSRILVAGHSPQLAVLAIKEGVVGRDR